MGPESNDWNEYRLMILDWHNQDIIEKREIRERLEAQEVRVTTQLSEIQATLAGFTAVKEKRHLILNLVVPALVALGVLAGEAAVAHIWR